MKSNRIMWLLVMLAVSATIAITSGAFDSRGQVKTDAQAQPTPANSSTKPDSAKAVLDELKKDFPRVDYLDDRSVDSERQKRSEKYGKYPVLNRDITKDDQETSFIDWADNLPALPVKESEIIVIARVIDAQAYLSTNKNSVYSEFTLEIEKQFKNTSRQFSAEDKTLAIEREGGIVRYPSGFETLYSISGQRMPKVSKKYLFFLTSQFPLYGPRKDDLYLITAYELANGKVIPLDSPNGGSHQIAIFYRGKDAASLLNDLHDAIGNYPCRKSRCRIFLSLHKYPIKRQIKHLYYSRKCNFTKISNDYC